MKAGGNLPVAVRVEVEDLFAWDDVTAELVCRR